MGDAEIFGGGVFITLWLISFFGYTAFQLRRGYLPIPSDPMVARDAAVHPLAVPSARSSAGSPRHASLSTH